MTESITLPDLPAQFSFSDKNIYTDSNRGRILRYGDVTMDSIKKSPIITNNFSKFLIFFFTSLYSKKSFI